MPLNVSHLLCSGAILTLGLFIGSSIQAQDADPGAKAKTQMQRLAVLEGNYSLVVHVSNDDGKTWQAGPAQKVNLRLRHNGLLLEELPVELAEQGFHMNTYITFDQYRSVFRKAAIDDVWGVMDIYQGKIEEDTLVLTNLESGTLFPVGPDTWRGFRLSVPLVAGERTMLIEKTDDYGESWQPAFKSVYTPEPTASFRMLKLYKLDEQPGRYWETWDNDDGSHTVHWGVLGETGDSKTVKSSLLKKATDKIQVEVDEFVSKGYRPVDMDAHRILLVEYAVDGFGTDKDLDKRHELESRLNNTLGWAGLGHCDGGSIGSDTMEACCYVVDFEIAKSVIEADLEGTEFADYTRIYDEGAEK